MRIAIASSGLGHVARGIETWARDSAEVLSARVVEKAGVPRSDSLNVTLFCGAPLAVAPRCRVEVLPVWKRTGTLARTLARISPGFTWRWCLKNPYGWEQWSFWQRLGPRLRDGRYDILHVQDPMLAYWCRRCREAGQLETREILAHGTEESAVFLSGFPFVQHLAPWHAEAIRATLPPGADTHWTTMPNFIDTTVFRPAADETEKRECRKTLGIPADAFVVGSVAAVKQHHKRVDYLIREFHRLVQSPAQGTAPARAFPGKPFLLVAGSRTPQTDEVLALAERLIPGQFRILTDWPRERMPELYRAMDVFALASLFEMMPIAVLEAIASGVPVLANRHAVLQWMIGIDRPDEQTGGGLCLDMRTERQLAETLMTLTPAWIAQHGRHARAQAERVFAKDVVIAQYLAYYDKVRVASAPARGVFTA